MTDASPPPDDYCPLDDDTAAIQLESLIRLTGEVDGCVVDLGCGDGRLAIPLARAGRTVLAVDHDPAALQALESKLEHEDEATSSRIVILQADIATLPPESLQAAAPGPIACALCLGHTFMLLHDPLDALAMLRTLSGVLIDGGFFAIDDFPHDFWYEVSEGNWQSGIAEMEAEDGSGTELWQMVWKPGEPVIAIRRGEDVDPDEIEIQPTDRLHRIYSIGELRLLAACSGFALPRRAAENALIIFGLSR
jgi:SAM-dependent methyltransferase